MLEKKRGKHQQPFLGFNNNKTNYSPQYKSKKEDKKKKMNDAAAATFDAVSDGVSDVKDTVGKYVQFNANKTNFFIKLRKNLDVRFPGHYSSFVLCVYVSVVVVLY